MRNISTRVSNYFDNKLRRKEIFSNQKGIIIPLLFIFSFVFLYFLIDSSNQSLVAHDEGLYARRSLLIEDSSNWFSSPFSKPHHKTLGSYWLIALSIRFFGTSELALRLPSILASFICLFTSYLIALKITNKNIALISVFSLSSMPLWVQYSRYASPDIPFVLCILLVIYFFLKSLEGSNDITNYFYIFLSGLLITTSFFIRSYMAFVPIIGLTPFFIFNLCRKKIVFSTIFFSGNLIGLIPTFLNLYYSYQKFGAKGITTLFDFAKKQAIGNFDLTSYLFIPLNFLFFTLPTGILLLILITFTRSNSILKYPLLVYVFPAFSLVILLCMSTSYPHYYLFLLPSLSILFAAKLQFHSFKFSSSKTNIKYVLTLFIIFISCFILLLFIYFKNDLLNYSFSVLILASIISTFLVISYLSSIRFLFNYKEFQTSLTKFFYYIVIPQYISLSLLFNFGILGNPNYKTKLFLKDSLVSSIINSNTISLFEVDSKIETLLSYYLPYSRTVKSFNEIIVYDYIITSNINLLNSIKGRSEFKTIKNFDNHFLLMKIGN